MNDVIKNAKSTVKLIAMDYDGTISGGEYGQETALDLVKKISEKGKYVALLTARNATILRIFEPTLMEFQKSMDIKPFFIGGGNGVILYKFDKSGRSEVYNFGLKEDETLKIVKIVADVYEELGIKREELVEKGLKTFGEFLTYEWMGLVPEKLVIECKKYDGKIFAEEAKVSCVLVTNAEVNEKFVAKIREKLDEDKYHVIEGDTVFLHITRKQEAGVDPKLFALKTVMKEIEMTDPKEVAVFGDMPTKNDKGLLVESGLPYSFTNDANYQETEIPYVLEGSVQDPVGSVYKTIFEMIAL